MSSKRIETLQRWAKAAAVGGPEPSSYFFACAERWVRSVKQECLSKLILFGEASLRRVLAEFVEHYHQERNHQGKGNILLFPSQEMSRRH